MFLGTNPPERFRDYADYIRHYSDQINLMLAGDVDELVKAKLINLSELALKNITDAITRWPDLETSAA